MEKIKKKFKFLVIDTVSGVSWALSSDRLVSKLLNDTYDIKLSHMYIMRNLKEENYILKDNILIKKIWQI
tara:strand:- start:166 stop:375 length:210 start_codon:yes stop_codon:yes gene_type:complete